MNTISFKDIFLSDVKPPATLLIEGSAGTLKSTLCFSLMVNYLKNRDLWGLYTTFEQSWESHLLNMNSLGLKPSKNILSLDYNIMRKDFPDIEENLKIFDSILEILKSLKEEKGDKFQIFALDSLNAIYSIMDKKLIEFSLFSFFKKLKQLNLISLLIYEGGEKRGLKERFLADGIISLGIQRYRGEVIRYLRVSKYKFGKHSLRRKQIVANNNGIFLLGDLYQ